jgi:hypothetical protein
MREVLLDREYQEVVRNKYREQLLGMRHRHSSGPLLFLYYRLRGLVFTKSLISFTDTCMLSVQVSHTIAIHRDHRTRYDPLSSTQYSISIRTRVAFG